MKYHRSSRNDQSLRANQRINLHSIWRRYLFVIDKKTAEKINSDFKFYRPWRDPGMERRVLSDHVVQSAMKQFYLGHFENALFFSYEKARRYIGMQIWLSSAKRRKTQRTRNSWVRSWNSDRVCLIRRIQPWDHFGSSRTIFSVPIVFDGNCKDTRNEPTNSQQILAQSTISCTYISNISYSFHQTRLSDNVGLFY